MKKPEQEKNTPKQPAEPLAGAKAAAAPRPQDETPNAEPVPAKEKAPGEQQAEGQDASSKAAQAANPKEADGSQPAPQTAPAQPPAPDSKPAPADGDTQKPEAPEPPEPTPAAGEAAGEIARLTAELLAARCLNAAYAAGVLPGMAGDAATLAAAEAGPDADAAAAGQAVAAILKRHPDWKAGGEGGKKGAAGGFQLGADPDKAAGRSPAAKSAGTANKKRWNRFK